MLGTGCFHIRKERRIYGKRISAGTVRQDHGDGWPWFADACLVRRRFNLHLRFGPDAPGGVLLSGHTDVVPAGSGWATDPYELTEVDGQLRARGSADMKGFLAAANLSFR